MRFYYDEDSNYGQMVLELLALVESLRDPSKTYDDTEVHDILTEISAHALMIRRQNDRTAHVYDKNTYRS